MINEFDCISARRRLSFVYARLYYSMIQRRLESHSSLASMHDFVSSNSVQLEDAFSIARTFSFAAGSLYNYITESR